MVKAAAMTYGFVIGMAVGWDAGSKVGDRRDQSCLWQQTQNEQWQEQVLEK